MESSTLAISCTIGVLLGGGVLYCFLVLLGPAVVAEKVEDKYKSYWSFFRRPKEIKKANEVPAFVDTFYNLVTDMYEWGWGPSFHFSPSIPGKSHEDVTRLYQIMTADLIHAKAGEKILDVGCGVGGPMRTIAAHSRAKVVGITINQYQVDRACLHNKKAGLDPFCEVICGNFLDMPFPDNSFDAAYAIQATCHAPKLEEVYGEVFRVLKPGALYVAYEWVTTDKYDRNNIEHLEIIHEIEIGNALPGLRSYADLAKTARKVGFEVVEEKDLAAPPAGPWWTGMKMGKIACWRNRILITVLAAIGIVPKGTFEVHEMLFKTAGYLTRGGETGIFSPSYMILCRKPQPSAHASS